MMRDGPASGRMGFGYRQHREAGVPFRAPSSNGQINLRQFLARHPHLRDRVDAAQRDGQRPASIIEDLRLEGCDGEFSVVLYRGREGNDFVEERFGACPDQLRELVNWGLGIRVYGSAELWQLGPDGEWSVIQTWPAEMSPGGEA